MNRANQDEEEEKWAREIRAAIKWWISLLDESLDNISLYDEPKIQNKSSDGIIMGDEPVTHEDKLTILEPDVAQEIPTLQ